MATASRLFGYCFNFIFADGWTAAGHSHCHTLHHCVVTNSTIAVSASSSTAGMEALKLFSVMCLGVGREREREREREERERERERREREREIERQRDRETER